MEKLCSRTRSAGRLAPFCYAIHSKTQSLRDFSLLIQIAQFKRERERVNLLELLE